MGHFLGPCPVCNGMEFFQINALWKELINLWQLSESEVEYVNRQQGFHCKQCLNNLRAMALAAAILREYQFDGSLIQFSKARPELRILEINKAGNLTSFLQTSKSHRLIEYPEFDMLDLDIIAESVDLIIHSDTLEHVNNPERALSECRRVLKKNGRCIFTVPIIVDRMTRSRVGLEPSYHGPSSILLNDMRVCTEFGVDFWKVALMAGFYSCEIFSLEYPAALVLICKI